MWESDKMAMEEKIDDTLRDLISRLGRTDLYGSDISDYSWQYLKKYTSNSSYFISFYSQVLEKCLRSIKKPLNESVFVDYGGGCGILSLAAKKIGFKTVIYNDSYEKMLLDAKIISTLTGIPVDHFICGDAGDFVLQMNSLRIHPDLICSVDVLEHIYDLERWFKYISKLNDFNLIFVNGANPVNPLIRTRLKRLHRISEYRGCERNVRINDTFLNTSFVEERGKIIRNKFPELSENDIKHLSLESRGLKLEDIENLVSRYISDGVIDYRPDHATNTCDPYTGSWAERLIDLRKLNETIRASGMEMSVTNTFYSYSNNRLSNTLKRFVNLLIKISGPRSLFFSPGMFVEIRKA